MHARSVLACLAAGLVLTGCGSDPQPAPPAAANRPAAVVPAAGNLSVPTAPAAKGAPAAAASDAAAKGAGAAAAINLVAADLPTFVDNPAVVMTPGKQLALERAETCVQAPSRTLRVTHTPGRLFRHPATAVQAGSDVQVMKDVATARKEAATLDHPKVDTCLRNMLGEVLALESGGTVAVIGATTRPLKVASSGGVAARGRRVEAKAIVPGGEMRLWLDLVVLQHRSTVTALTLMSVGTPPDAGQRVHLTRLLNDRLARAAV